MAQTLLPLTLFFVFLGFSHAYHFSIQGRQLRSRLGRRGNTIGTLALSDQNDITYLTNVTLGGELFTIVIDTGR